MPRRLSLKSERLADLTQDELAALAGQGLPTSNCTGYYTTLNAPCPSLDCFTGNPSLVC